MISARKVFTLICSVFLFASAFGQYNTSKMFTPDTLSVLRNPCTGWAIYCEGWEFENTWRSIYPEVNGVSIRTRRG